MNQGVLDKFISDQLSVWPLAATNFRSLKAVETRKLEVNGLEVCLQHNPERIKSTSAKVDKASIKARKCFLCGANRPEEQFSLKFEGRKDRKYDILVNPYPIFPQHLVIASTQHQNQSIWHKLGDLADLAHHYTDFTFFYNGPRCGASAPDHLHFQGCPRHIMPLENEIDRLLSRIADVHQGSGVPDGQEVTDIPEDIQKDIEFVSSVQEAQLYHYKHFTRGVFALRARTSKSLAKLFYRLLDCAPIPEGETEPMFNLIIWYAPVGEESTRPSGCTHGMADFEYRAIVLCRGAHRPHHFNLEGEGHLGLSPGCADMAGLFIVPATDDYQKLNEKLIGEVLSEVSVSEKVESDILWRLTRTQETIQVGIMSANEIEFEILSDGAGKQKVSYQEGKIAYNGALYDELKFDSITPSTLFAEPTFVLYDVVIGVNFHWQRKVDQKFAGSLKFIIENGKVVAVNVIGVEDYLVSVISSEMKSTAPLEFLKVHSVISRSWVMSQISHRLHPQPKKEVPDVKDVPSLVTRLDAEAHPVGVEGDCPEIIQWFDHDDHKKFDVCADDHCQRYQGLTMVASENVKTAIDQTWGEVLTYEGEICDARFYKSCGGMTEKFSSCWEDKDYEYLPALPDTPNHDPEGHCFCDTHDKRILSQVLNDYDLETVDFYEWKEEYTREELSELITRRSGIEIGTLQSLEPIKRGPSGRIITLKVVGDKKSFIIGKELMVRRILSESHLKSSNFIVKVEGDKFILEGHGWGHGVGLCQIGAAVMVDEGYSYDQVLEHYYPHSHIERKTKL